MITFEGLRRVQSAEKKTGISKLPPNFFLDVADYFESTEGLEKKNAENVLEDILEARELKIIKLAFGAAHGEQIAKGNLTDMERKLFDELVKNLQKHRTKVLNKDNHKKVKTRVRFLQDFPQFVGIDGEYGPFTAGSVAEIPPENAELLITKKVVEYETTPKD